MSRPGPLHQHALDTCAQRPVYLLPRECQLLLLLDQTSVLLCVPLLLGQLMGHLDLSSALRTEQRVVTHLLGHVVVL